MGYFYRLPVLRCVLLDHRMQNTSCGLLLQMEWSGTSVCLYVNYDREHRKNGSTNRDAVVGETRWASGTTY